MSRFHGAPVHHICPGRKLTQKREAERSDQNTTKLRIERNKNFRSVLCFALGKVVRSSEGALLSRNVETEMKYIYMLISHLSASSGNTETTVQTGWARPVPTDDWLTRARIARHSSSFLRNNAAIISRTRISCRRFDGCRSNFPLLFARFISVYAPPKVCWTIRDDGFGCAKIARCARARVCVPSGPTNPCTRMTNKKSTKQNGKKTSRKKQKYVERRTRPLARQITLIYVRESAPFRKSVK